MIHESGNKLLEHDKKKLEPMAKSEEQKAFEIMRSRPGNTFTAFEMGQLLRAPRGNAARALSNLSGSDSRYRDNYGNFPVRKREDIRRRDPGGKTRNVTYQWNPFFGKKSEYTHGQLSLLDEG